MSTEAAAASNDTTAQSRNVSGDVLDAPDAVVREPADDAAAADGESHQNNNNTVDQPDAHIKAKGAPQAKSEESETSTATTATTTAPDSPGGSGNDGEFEDCKISPLDAENQRRNLKSALMAVSQ